MSLLLWSDVTITWDMPGPYTLEWSSKRGRRRIDQAGRNPIPIATGLAFAGAPYAIGAAIVYFGPAPMKPLGASMLVPGPTDPILFAMGYRVGDDIDDDIRQVVSEFIRPQMPSSWELDHRHFHM